MITIKSEAELKLMRRSGQVVGQALVELGKRVKPGVTTEELDKFAFEFFKKNDCVPAFKGYHGYPATICTSINEEVVHGIPSKRVLKDGDVVGIDIGAFYKGYCGDSARTFGVGKISSEVQKLLEVTFKALDKGSRTVPGGKPNFRYRPCGSRIRRIFWLLGCKRLCRARDWAGHARGTTSSQLWSATPRPSDD